MCSNGLSALRRIAGLTLAAAALAAAVYGLRAATAQVSYHRLKFGGLAGIEPERKQPFAADADRIYRHNYYLSMLMADDYWNRRHADGGKLAAERTSSAAHWCGRGIAQNPYRRELRWMEALLAGDAAPTVAAGLWREYVNFAFWDPRNIAGLVVLEAAAGRIEEAMELLPLLRGGSQYAEALKAVQTALRSERQTPPGVNRSPDRP